MQCLQYNGMVIITLCLLLTLVFPTVSCAEMSSTNYHISSNVLSGGGGFMASDSFFTDMTLGQPTPVGSSTSSVYTLDGGFWHTCMLIAAGDINGDGDVDLQDVITVLQIITGDTPATVMRKADIDGNNRIDLVESIAILRTLAGNGN